MSRVYLHRYKVLAGPLTGQVHDGIQIGFQDYPEQFVKEGWDSHKIAANTADKGDGVWLIIPSVRLNRHVYHDMTFTDEGVNYSNDYMDLCVPFDRFNNEIFVGDTIYVSSNNEVVPCVVEKIAKKPFMASYGIVNRKLTVRPIEGGTAKTINDPRSTVRVDNKSEI